MIAIIRLHSRVSQSKCWKFVAQNQEKLREALGDNGLMLYLTQRVGKDDTSLFVHTAQPDMMGRFVSEQLAATEGIDGIWMIPLFEPRFFPVPRHFETMQRYALSLRVAPNDMHGARVGLEQMTLPENLKMAYIAYTFHQYDNCISYSLIAEDKFAIQEHLDRVEKHPKILQVLVHSVERTRALMTHAQWVEYSSQHLIVPSWKEEHMLDQFRL